MSPPTRQRCPADQPGTAANSNRATARKPGHNDGSDLPPLTTARQALDLDAVDAVALAVALSVRHPHDVVVVAARLGVELAETRCKRRRDEKAAAVAISEAMDWAAFSRNHVSHEELQRRRAVPGPLATDITKATSCEHLEESCCQPCADLWTTARGEMIYHPSPPPRPRLRGPATT